MQLDRENFPCLGFYRATLKQQQPPQILSSRHLCVGQQLPVGFRIAAEVEPAALPHSHAPRAAHRARASPTAPSYTVGEVHLLPLLLGTVHSLALGAADGRHKLFLRRGVNRQEHVARASTVGWGGGLLVNRQDAYTCQHLPRIYDNMGPQSKLLACLELFLRRMRFADARDRCPTSRPKLCARPMLVGGTVGDQLSARTATCSTHLKVLRQLLDAAVSAVPLVLRPQLQ